MVTWNSIGDARMTANSVTGEIDTTYKRLIHTEEPIALTHGVFHDLTIDTSTDELDTLVDYSMAAISRCEHLGVLLITNRFSQKSA